ncbi:hypothetical protein [Bradyrhizobium sp. WD16]|uniref:hypothetical protein n=1 Tax=Bradyrhizobium sp. WD16 TaxID=1521768 RepID=UPI0020A2BB68|nr:hypothetical protein [Bradyrhizobium sp. WD16]
MLKISQGVLVATAVVALLQMGGDVSFAKAPTKRVCVNWRAVKVCTHRYPDWVDEKGRHQGECQAWGYDHVCTEWKDVPDDMR